MMKSGSAERAPLLQKSETNDMPQPGAIAAAVRQAKRGVGVFGVALALSGVLVAVLNAPDTSKTAFELQMAATTPAATSADEELCVPNKWAPGSFTDPTKDQKNRSRSCVEIKILRRVSAEDFIASSCSTGRRRRAHSQVITTTRLDKKV